MSFGRFSVGLLMAAGVLAASSRTWGQDDPAGRPLADGIRQVEEGDLEGAVITLDGVVRRLADDRKNEKQVALAHLYLGMAHLGLSQWELAKNDMREAWRNDPAMKLDAKKFPPRVRQLYAEVLSEEQRLRPDSAPAATSAKATATPRNAGGSGLVLGLVAGGAAAAAVGVTVSSHGVSATPKASEPTPVPPHAIDGRWVGDIDNSGTREVLVLNQPDSLTVTGISTFEDVRTGNLTDKGAVQGTLSNPTAPGAPVGLTMSLVRDGVTYTGLGTFNPSLTVLTGHWIGASEWTYVRQ
jgi:hypothetical protein